MRALSPAAMGSFLLDDLFQDNIVGTQKLIAEDVKLNAGQEAPSHYEIWEYC